MIRNIVPLAKLEVDSQEIADVRRPEAAGNNFEQRTGQQLPATELIGVALADLVEIVEVPGAPPPGLLPRVKLPCHV
jgi:hypothetical protein